MILIFLLFQWIFDNFLNMQYQNQQTQIILFQKFYYNISIQGMSLRQAKQLLEQKKTQQQKKKINQHPKQEDQDEQLEQVIVKKKNAFTFQSFDNDDSQEQTKPKQILKDNQEVEDNTEENKKKKKKKKKKKVTEEQQLQNTLKQLGLNQKIQSKENIKQSESKIFETILQIHESKFNYEKQLRRHFRDWEEDLPEKDPELDRRQQKMQKHLRKMMKKSVLSPGIKEYFPINEKFDIERSENGKIKFIPTKKYQSFQVQYQAIRNSNDINALFMFTQTHPEHVDSLYAVGQFLRLQGNYRDADALIQKVIYIYEMAGSYDLMEFVKYDLLKKQIVYDATSKSLFMSLFKFMDILGKKGCYRAALQYNKLLLKINLNDPSASLLCLDYNSISSNQPEFLVDFVTYFSHYIGKKQTSLYLLPNFIYSFALAKFSIENKPAKNQSQMVIEQNNITDLILFSEQDWKAVLTLPSHQSFIKQNCRTLILRAIMVYPKLILDIANKNEYGKQFLNHPKFQGNQKKGFKNILEHQFWTMVPQSYSYHFLKLQNQNDSKGLDKVLQVYVQRSKILWKSNDVMLWIKGALGFVLNQIDKEFNYQSYLENLCTQQSGGAQIPFSLSRYENISRANFSDRVDRIDLNNIQDNQNVRPQQNANRINVEGNPFRLFLNSLLPWVHLPQNNLQNDPNMPDIQEDE